MDYHQPVLLKESVAGLKIKPEGIYVDATFGGGGHSKEILNRLQKGRLIVFDQDEDAFANVPEDERIVCVKHNFRFLKNFLKYYKIDQIDGLIADLGVSSHHFDTPQRGFSFRFNSDLDMRMNAKANTTASDVINTYSEEELSRIFYQYGELKKAKLLAASIVQMRKATAITSVRGLIESVENYLPRHRENQYLAKIFQALRIEVNHEIENLKELLLQSVGLLRVGARIAIISYHSLEDRMVKNFFKTGSCNTGEISKDFYGNIQRPLKPVNNKAIVPDEEEIRTNSRARSAKLRIAEKISNKIT
ncbi:MAG: 16S rRNA (cytosine(1402)-N(4))-methyltransferase RsmH [Bacteroidales bacterium]|nr:16S rRNA (cytosine(1402)-N(4))-methyltransferase RsmH [Bacteroidales bacterium]